MKTLGWNTTDGFTARLVQTDQCFDTAASSSMSVTLTRDRKMLQSSYVLLQDCGSSTLFSLLLSFSLNLRVGLNDPCVLRICYPKLGVCTQHHTSGMAQVKCRSQIVTHTWEQEKASLFSFFFFFSSPILQMIFVFPGWRLGENKKALELIVRHM